MKLLCGRKVTLFVVLRALMHNFHIMGYFAVWRTTAVLRREWSHVVKRPFPNLLRMCWVNLSHVKVVRNVKTNVNT